jgi:3-methyladenine DNA glycosylase/8-oxoguanine DNA glycosylase
MTGVLPFDPARALRHLRRADPELASLIKAVGAFRLEVNAAHDTFTALAEAIIYQQLSPRAAATIHNRFCALFGELAVPSPTLALALSEEQLRSPGLSRAKAMAIKDLAARTLAGEVPTVEQSHALDDEELVQRLSAVRGIGRWTAEMFLMFRLGRPDVLPLGDYGLRRGFGAAFGLGRVATPAEVEQRGQKWRPYRSVASWYLWRAVEAAPAWG